MITPHLKQTIADLLPGKRLREIHPCHGGDTHRAYQIRTEDGDRYFIKLNTAAETQILHSEADSLQHMQALFNDAYPRLFAFHHDPEIAVLLMSWHSLATIDSRHAAALGSLLARQHKVSHSHHGWKNDNFIGSTPQANSWSQDWASFFCYQRLAPQLARARSNEIPHDLYRLVEQLIDSPPVELRDHQPTPALLHGDLWYGNAGWDQDSNKPMLFDPAPYFGDAETDLAMTELFGRYDDRFYRTYHAIHPILPGYKVRRACYKLYHALNHFNLFGASYLPLVREQINAIERNTA